MPLLEGLRVIQSKIHGYGVIATRPIKAGEIICYGDGVLYDDKTDFDDTYALIFDKEDIGTEETLFWDLACQTRWFNHSCDPNTEVCGKWVPEEKAIRAWWVALRDIPVGEEILYDYGFAAEVAEPCFCGAPTCRGVIVDEDPEVQAELPEDMQKLLRVTRRAS